MNASTQLIIVCFILFRIPVCGMMPFKGKARLPKAILLIQISSLRHSQEYDLLDGSRYCS